MPRPGPRPYECVRRAWHSDRHQPIRGSIIQQIFRAANDAHSAATRKNKEWLEKLPIVVLKAEEIMYSKANSEAEYVDPQTLLDRLNDAINTIIRRDESSETGQLLPPCIEAALNLGCIPVRASRSQRHSNPRTYLSPRVQEPLSVPLRAFEKTNEKQCPHLSQFQSTGPLNFSTSHMTVSSMVPVSEYNHILNEKIRPDCTTLLTKETSKELKLGSVYPLYYGSSCPIRQSDFINVPDKSFNDIIIGQPICKSVAGATGNSVAQNLFFCPSADLGNIAQEKPCEPQYDLSLRLGPSTDRSMGIERSLGRDTEDFASCSSQDKGNYTHLSQWRNPELFLSPSNGKANYFFDFGPSNLDTSIRKRKAPIIENMEDEQFCRRPEFPSNCCIDRVER